MGRRPDADDAWPRDRMPAGEMLSAAGEASALRDQIRARRRPRLRFRARPHPRRRPTRPSPGPGDARARAHLSTATPGRARHGIGARGRHPSHASLGATSRPRRKRRYARASAARLFAYARAVAVARRGLRIAEALTGEARGRVEDEAACASSSWRDADPGASSSHRRAGRRPRSGRAWPATWRPLPSARISWPAWPRSSANTARPPMRACARPSLSRGADVVTAAQTIAATARCLLPAA